MTPPLVGGGQGGDGDDCRSSAVVVAIGLAVGFWVVFAVWFLS